MAKTIYFVDFKKTAESVNACRKFDNKADAKEFAEKLKSLGYFKVLLSKC